MEWSRQYSSVVWLDSNGHSDKYSSAEALMAVYRQTDMSENSYNTIDEVQDFIDKKKDWLFGFISYDFKNTLEKLESKNPDTIGFPELHFFCPEKIIRFNQQMVEFHYLIPFENEIEKDFTIIQNLMPRQSKPSKSIRIQMRMYKEAYFKKVNQILDHIRLGNIYEVNFCQEFYSNHSTIDPWSTYKHLNAISQPPFASFVKYGDAYLMGASPERYLKKIGGQVISQPIKGTSRRDGIPVKDELLKRQLANDMKERSENIMITDLVRNDLSRSASRGSVAVTELCKVYTFKQVHQMISTVTSEVSPSIEPTQLIKDTFPMGSMTGAPKISAMNIIEEMETSKRGLYSGTVGYFEPNGNFDFNVVIRSILYNAARKYVSYSVGSAITARSIPEKEYEECLLKAKAMRSVLEAKNS